jgi:hypothetical protein
MNQINQIHKTNRINPHLSPTAIRLESQSRLPPTAQLPLLVEPPPPLMRDGPNFRMRYSQPVEENKGTVAEPQRKHR